MATNNTQRSVIKWVRDGIKSKYEKGNKCAICDTTEELEFHHYHTVSLLVNKFLEENSFDISTKENILVMREEFYQHYHNEMVHDAVTLCASHHKLLHKIYGTEPKLNTAEKQKNWVLAQHEKTVNGIDTRSQGKYLPASLTQFCIESSPFTRFLTR